MVLGPTEEVGIRAVLGSLDSGKLPSLLSTITSGIVKSKSSEESIELIVKYCKDAFDVLKRQKVAKADLFKYLKDQNIDISPKSDKGDMIQACLKLWQASPATEKQLAEFKDWEMADADDFGDETFVSSPRPLSPGRLGDMGRTFMVWFYDLLKNYKDIYQFNISHFWPDCTLDLETSDPKDQENKKLTSIRGNNSVYEYIYAEIDKTKILFVPNHFNFPQTTLTNTGSVIIEIEGFIHRYSFPVGIFRHNFGLIEDPSSDQTWRIKFIQMNHKLGTRAEGDIPDIPF